ncbi:hypothetical protein [Gemmatimonas sp.]|uniref:hypothetical protein n=1 Tax=Gemmatimonas sp. TaxID=1962908 RepID=UPI003F6F4E6C
MSTTICWGWALAGLCLGGCAGRQVATPQVTSDCSRFPEAAAVRTDSVPLSRLTGRFSLVLIDTVNRQLPPNIDTVTLGPPDSAYMAALEAQATRWGFVTKPVGPVRTNSRTGPMEYRTDGKEMVTGTCAPLRCMDESPTYFTFRFLSPHSIRGEWANGMTGIAMLADPKTGRRLPPPAGVFCLLRL